MSRYSRGKTSLRERCSFCGRDRGSAKLVAGPIGVFICGHCVAEHMARLSSAASAPPEPVPRPSRAACPTPAEICRHIDRFVTGQQAAKKVLAVAVHAHHRRVALLEQSANPDDVPEKSNVLLIGPTGSGKTLLARSLAKVLDLPFVIADATPLTEAGYVGEDVESILTRLLQAAGNDLKRAERGIVYIDEIDKIGRPPHHHAAVRDVSGTGVQQALLKILEGTVANVPPPGARKHDQRSVRFVTDHVLFICGGTFPDLERIIERRLGKSRIGFGGSAQRGGRSTVECESLLPRVRQIDLIQFGLIPEMVGRLPVIATVAALTSDEIIAAMTQPKNAILRQFQAYFALEGRELTVTPSALACIAEIVKRRGTGVRALRSIFEELLLEERFYMPGAPERARFVVTRAFVRQRLGESDSSHDERRRVPHRRSA